MSSEVEVWLSDIELKGVQLDKELYNKSYQVKLTGGRNYTLVSSKEKENITEDVFVPYALMEEGINNSLVQIDGLDDILIYEGEHIQCLDVLTANGINVNQLVKAERVQLTREQLNILTGDKLQAKSLKPTDSSANPVKIIAVLGTIIAVIAAFFVVM